MTEDSFDSELNELFAQPQAFDDDAAFEARALRKLTLRLWLRQWLVVMAGVIGGVYAVFQFVRVPTGTLQSLSPLKQAETSTDHSLQAGVKLFDQAGHQLSSLTGYLDMLQTPMFFWVAFALCMSFLGLYYAYSREERL